MLKSVIRYASADLRATVHDKEKPLCDRLVAVVELASRHENTNFLTESVTADSATIGTALVGCFLSSPATPGDADQAGLCAVAQSELAHVVTRLLALEHIKSTDDLLKIALEARAVIVGVAATQRLTKALRQPGEALCAVRESARHPRVRAFAHAIITEDDGK